MDVFTQAVWKVIEEDEELLAELGKMMRREHKPFLNQAQAFEANATMVKERILERFQKWLNWLPTLPISLIGLVLAEEAMQFVEWRWIAAQLRHSSAAAR